MKGDTKNGLARNGLAFQSKKYLFFLIFKYGSEIG